MSSGATIDEAGCEADPYDPACSCYNVVKDKCTEYPDAPGCAEGNEWLKSLTDVIPAEPEFDSARSILTLEAPQRYHCNWVGACGEGKLKPQEYHDLMNTGRCEWKLNMCSSDVDVGESINSRFFRDCTIGEMGFTDLDSVYGLDSSVMYGGEIRTAENAAYVAAKNKQLQLEIRKEDREKAAERQAEQEILEIDRLKKVEEIREEYEENRNKKILTAAFIIAIIIIALVMIFNI
jgi:hypothetical protein